MALHEIGKGMVNVSKLDFNLVCHRFKQILQLWEAQFIPLKIER